MLNSMRSSASSYFGKTICMCISTLLSLDLQYSSTFSIWNSNSPSSAFFQMMSETHHFSDLPATCSYSCLIHRVVFGGLNHLVGPGYLLHYSAKSRNPLIEYLRTMRNQ